KRQLSFLAILLAASFPLACKSGAQKNEAPAQPTPRYVGQATLIEPRAPEVVTAAPSSFKKTFVGTIGDKLAVQMDIERDGSKITGSYFYDKPGAYNLAYKLLDLNGKVDKEGNVTLDESGYETGEKKLTGTFKGKLDAVTINNLPALRLVGTWTSSKNQKSLAGNLKTLNFCFLALKLPYKHSKYHRNKDT